MNNYEKNKKINEINVHYAITRHLHMNNLKENRKKNK